jgi:DNA-binding transcriptional MocR family regulator
MFRRLAQALADDVASGRVPTGTRLPPHRELADDLGVARGTVARFYAEAESLGLIRGEVGRGTYVLGPDRGERVYGSLFEPPTALRDLSTSIPLRGIDPDPRDVLRRLAERPDRRALLRYHSPLGAARHRAAGKAWVERLGLDVRDPDEILVCAGAQHALFLVLTHLATRSPVLYVEELTYPGIHGIAETAKLEVVPIAIDRGGIDIADLERAATRRGPGALYCMPTIHNPLGIVASRARREEIARIARAHGLWLVEDAANRMLVEQPPPALRALAPERTYFVASTSKILGPGLRVAFVLAPPGELPALGRRLWATSWMTSAIGAEIAAMWIEDGTLDRTLALKRREAKRRQAVLRELFAPSSVDADPRSMHAWIRIPRSRAKRSIDEAARQEIVVTPSSAFWARTTRPPDAVRVSLASLDSLAQLRRGLRGLADVVSR